MGQNLSYVVRKDTKQLIFDWGQMQFFIVQPDTAGSKINFQFQTLLNIFIAIQNGIILSITEKEPSGLTVTKITRRRARSSSTEKGFVR